MVHFKLKIYSQNKIRFLPSIG